MRGIERRVWRDTISLSAGERKRKREKNYGTEIYIGLDRPPITFNCSAIRFIWVQRSSELAMSAEWLSVQNINSTKSLNQKESRKQLAFNSFRTISFVVYSNETQIAIFQALQS